MLFPPASNYKGLVKTTVLPGLPLGKIRNDTARGGPKKSLSSVISANRLDTRAKAWYLSQLPSKTNFFLLGASF